MKRIYFFAFIFAGLAGLSSGCVYIPTNYYASGSRQNVTAQSTNLIQTGTDTMGDVILKLGEPDAVSPDEHRIAYSSEKIVGLLFFVGVPAPDNPEIPTYHYLNVEFNNGVVTNQSFTKQQFFKQQASLLAGSIGGEKIEISFPCWSSSGQLIAGNLILTDSKLYFVKETQWLNESPAVSLRYDFITGCTWTKNEDEAGSPALVVRTKDGQNYAFAIRDWRRSAQNTVESACSLIQSKIN
jgi:hypothetical protein